MAYTQSNKNVREALLAAADAIARVDIDQEAREAVAEEVAEAISPLCGRVGLRAEVFKLLASDPLVPCAGALGEPCRTGAVIRIPMHLRAAPDGRSAAWRQHAPYGEIRCVSCGAAQFIPGYAENRAREETA